MSLSPRLALLLSLPPLLWAGNAVIGRAMVHAVPPLTLNALRWSLAAVLLLPLAWRVLAKPRQVFQRWGYLLALGVLGVGLYNALQYLALVTSTPLNVTLVATSMPVWMLLVGALCFGARPSRGEVAGAALGLAGVLVVVSRGSLATLLAVQLVPGDLFILGAVLGWAFYSWLLVRPPPHMQGGARPSWDWAQFLFAQALFGAPCAALAAAGEQWAGAAPIQWGWATWATLAYVAIGPSIVAFRCWGLGVAEGGPALAAIFANVTPLFAALLSALVLGEPPQAYHALAFALIAGGIALSLRRRT